jgi:hypothetical protein
MCTFNGELFVREQLDSILSQSALPNEIVIADDGSTDSTRTIVEVWRAEVRVTHPEMDVVLLPVGDRLGVTRNFERAVRAATGDVIALSDQDDVWVGGRLASLVDALERESGCDLVFTDARLIDARGEDLKATLWNSLAITQGELTEVAQGNPLRTLLRRNIVTGATVVFRRRLLERALPFPDSWLHDEWLAMMAALWGGVLALPVALTLYRQHGANQVGVAETTWSIRWARLREPRGPRNSRLRERAHALHLWAQAHPEWVSPEQQHLIALKDDFESQRSRLSRARLARVFPVVGFVVRGRYSQFGRGAQDALRDVIQPAT